MAQSVAPIDGFQTRLARRFRKQQEFAAGYSPLYSRLFGVLADWLATEPQCDPVVDWLLQVSATRSSFDVPLLLLAGLHRDILVGVVELSALARYYPTVGGRRSPEDKNLAVDLREAILARKNHLAAFICTATVQTNETARGLCWLLPILYTGWQAIHLVDLGASAGLNLVADQRNYRLTGGNGDVTILRDLGSGVPVQFSVTTPGDCSLPAGQHVSTTILSRTGCDIAPIFLATSQEEQTLASFVWADQVDRMVKLRQGIVALHRINRSSVPVQLHQVNLPDDLTRFLEQRITLYCDAPVVLYNTYLTTYLHDKGVSLRSQLAAWAAQHPQPVLWLQWETLWEGPKPPDFGWVAWTADFWQAGRHVRWHLAWAHPHGTRIQWLSESADWANYWQKAAMR